ncbi:hypothetical protein B0T10DRAFT_581749 [Thelonectria olida]|uniref:Uncharacterized protein n=1 Tax=Thelonectria olida TaxID=1576542 RepID=A0A9P8VY46_9HYPO|nr:hypothetical protein B0T10DRAFT_581749 [Thelonectria olida]
MSEYLSTDLLVGLWLDLGMSYWLSDAFTAEYSSGANHGPASYVAVSAWLQSTGYNTTLKAVNAEQEESYKNDLSLWQGNYNTQVTPSNEAGPNIVIQNGAATVNGTTINGVSLMNGVLTWTDAANSSNGQLSLLSQLQSTILRPGYKHRDSPKPYLGPQFQGFYWANGQQQPAQPNIIGRQGIFPLSGAEQSSQEPLQASVLEQWGNRYQIYVTSSTSSGVTRSPNTLTIDMGGSVSLNGTALVQRAFANDILQWTSDTGNTTNGFLLMRTDTTGTQFVGYYWVRGQPGPKTPNWWGASSDNTSALRSGVQDLNEWVTLRLAGAQAVQTCMQMKLGKIVLDVSPRSLSGIWSGLRSASANITQWARSLEKGGPGQKDTSQPTDAGNGSPETGGGFSPPLSMPDEYEDESLKIGGIEVPMSSIDDDFANLEQ